MEYFISLGGQEISAHEAALIAEPRVSGVVLFGRNIGSLKSTKSLIDQLKGHKSDLQIAVDEEGGLVSRFNHLIDSPSQPYIASLKDENKIRRIYRRRSEFLRDVGVTINLAPVVDLSPNQLSYMYKRSFGSDPDEVVRLASVCIEEQKKAGIASCLKHFPGHGDTDIDSHHDLPHIHQNLEEWRQSEGLIFSRLINEAQPELIMVGHLIYPKIDTLPASLSAKWIDILKGELGYLGKTITDDIAMEAVDHNLSEREVTQAGVDIILSSRGTLS